MKIMSSIGFVFEMVFFILAGMTIYYSIIVSFIFLILGTILSVFVGNTIKKEAIKEYENEKNKPI